LRVNDSEISMRLNNEAWPKPEKSVLSIANEYISYGPEIASYSHTKKEKNSERDGFLIASIVDTYL